MQVDRAATKRALPKIKEMKPGSVFIQMDTVKTKAAYMVLEYTSLEQGFSGKRNCVDLDNGKVTLFNDEDFVVACRAVVKVEVPLG
jgi:hypothetical protein